MSTATTPTAPPIEAVAAHTVDARKIYGEAQTEVRALDGVTVDFADRPVHRDHGPVRLGQVDAAALRRRPRHAHLGPGLHRRRRPQHAERPRS